MDYQLAKELKNAGFPQKEHNGFSGIIPVMNGAEKTSYYPSLSELIEACGGKNFGLCRNNARTEEKAWGAFDHCIYELAENFGDGSTPSEAVARLWLALNKK